MKVILPAKASSSRVVNKNWKPFHDGKSLVEVKIEQLLKVFGPQEIYVSCEDLEKKALVDHYGVNFMHRDSKYCSDDTHWSDVFLELIKPFDAEDEIAWVHVTCPLFDEFQKVLETWQEVKQEHDSLIAVRPFKEFVLNEKGKPLNFSYGRWHEWSQDLPQWYLMDFPIHILPQHVMARNAYIVGCKPYLYPISGLAVDIDDQDEWEIAQYMYGKRHVQ